MLERFVNAGLAERLLPRDSFRPVPSIDERDRWRALPVPVRELYVTRAEEYLNWTWPSLPATLYMEYKRSGRRTDFESPYRKRRSALGVLALAECIEDSGRFMDAIIDGIWHICEETAWDIPPHKVGAARPRDPLPDASDPVVELFSAETAALLAWVSYLLQPRLRAITPLLGERIEREVKRRILNPYLERNDYPWMGFTGHPLNNWNPWINSTCLAAFLLLEDDQNRRRKATTKIMRSLDMFIASYPEDGGCDEGPGYWCYAAGALFESLELLNTATAGWIDVFSDPLIRNMGSYLYKVWISKSYYVNFADCQAKVNVPAELVFRYGKRIKDTKLQALGAYSHRLNGPYEGDSMVRRISALFGYAEISAETVLPPVSPSVWLKDTQIMASRYGTSDRELYVAAKGGHNGEAHNHNDVGSFIVFAAGAPVLVDVGAPEYTAKTFSSRRYELWPMQSSYHNLPTVNGFMQAPGSDFRATDVEVFSTVTYTQLSMNLAKSYPHEADIEKWRRTVQLTNGEEPVLAIADHFRLSRPTQNITFSLVSCRPVVVKAGRLLLRGKPDVCIAYDATLLDASVKSIDLSGDRWLRHTWGENLFRIVLALNQPLAEGTVRVSVLFC